MLHTKVNYMSKLLPNQVYAGLFEILKDQRMYHYSRVGTDYCHLTEQGEKAVVDWINMMAPQMHKLEQNILEKKAKEMVWSELKK